LLTHCFVRKNIFLVAHSATSFLCETLGENVVEGKSNMKILGKSILVIIAGTFFTFQPAGAQAKYLFHIPVFPGTVPFHTKNINNQEINLPFVTSLRVFRTADGSPIDIDTAISFYDSYFKRLGWKETIYKRDQREPYLKLRIDLFQNLVDHTHIQVAGDISLWIAPRDGMLIIFSEQWRISSPDQLTSNYVAKLSKTLSDAAEELQYNINKVYYSTEWPVYYENEYLLECTASTLSDTHIAHYSCTDTEGLIHATILTYADSTVAHIESKRQINEWNKNIIVENMTLGQNVILVNLDEQGIKGLLRFNKILLILSDNSGKQKDQLSILLKRLQKSVD